MLSKVVALTLTVLLAGQMAVAQEQLDEQTSSKQTPGRLRSTSPRTSKRSGKILEGVNVGLIYSAANSLETKTKSTIFEEKMKFESEGALGLGLRYASVRANNFGYLAGIDYFFSREIRSVQVTTGDLTYNLATKGAPKLSLLVLEPNMTYGLGTNLYLLAGPNYVIPFKSGNWGTTEFEPDFGMQAGVGGSFSESFFAEFQFQTLNPKIKFTSLATQESRLWGLVLRVGATF